MSRYKRRKTFCDLKKECVSIHSKNQRGLPEHTFSTFPQDDPKNYLNWSPLMMTMRLPTYIHQDTSSGLGVNVDIMSATSSGDDIMERGSGLPTFPGRPIIPGLVIVINPPIFVIGMTGKKKNVSNLHKRVIRSLFLIHWSWSTRFRLDIQQNQTSVGMSLKSYFEPMGTSSRVIHTGGPSWKVNTQFCFLLFIMKQ